MVYSPYRQEKQGDITDFQELGMLYIERDETGAITAIRRGEAQESAREVASLLDEEVQNFLRTSGDPKPLVQLLLTSDTAMGRVVEDLIDLLINRKIILFTDLPAEARDKILTRRQLRSQITGDQFMVDDII